MRNYEGIVTKGDGDYEQKVSFVANGDIYSYSISSWILDKQQFSV